MAIIKDIYEANARELMADLQKRQSKLMSARASAKPGGDFAETISAKIELVEEAILAVQNAHMKNLKSLQQ